MDFAPYQDTSPEATRTLSPPPGPNTKPSQIRTSIEGRRSYSPALPSPPIAPYNHIQPQRSFPDPWAPVREDSFGGEDGFGGGSGNGLLGGGGGGGLEGGMGGRAGRNEFETSLPIRMDWAACLAYLLLPPAGGVLLLVVERKSDYVRFHAWQSSLLFSALFVLHLLVSWSSFLSWVLFLVNLGLIGFLTFRAYRDADTLDRFEVPFFGALASKFLDDE